jgi:cellulose synthase/poly-beta-1,6-N-acetylglucosamine synthase-like glycosyltransferase
MIVLDVALSFAVVAMAVPVVVLAFEAVAALMPASAIRDEADRGSVCVLVPAHDESAVIGQTLAVLAPQLGQGDRLLVVADNCADDTAAIARAAGAEVIERADALRRGKGYALDFGVRHLAGDPPEVVVVVDADCKVSEDALHRLARAATATGRPAQALYLMYASDGSGIKARVGEFAWRVKNHVRPLGLANLGLPCQLMGTGMAFPWALLRDAKLASGEIVEDMKLGLDLARAGYPPLFCPEALVTSEFPADEGARGTQRTRWEHGHLGLIVTEAPSLFWQALRRGDAKLVALALDLAVPPLALLALTVGAVTVLAGLAGALGWASMAPFWVALGAFGLLVAAVLVVWAGWGRRILSPSELMVLPLYALAKVPLYVLFWVRRQTEWVRTRRG